MKEKWKLLIYNRKYLTVWILSLVLALIALCLVSLYLCYNETRTNTFLLDDFVLNQLPAVDVSVPLFSITWICILGSLPLLLRTPDRAMRVFWSIISIATLRTIVMYMAPLEAPDGIIPLRDPFLEGSFYDNKVLVKDLFFSGHTSNMALLAFLIDFKWLKKVLFVSTTVVAYLLLKQHVHYTVDVIAAPFFAYLSYRISIKVTSILISNVSTPDPLFENLAKTTGNTKQ